MTGRRDTDRWTYYEFGTRSRDDEITALIFDHFDQTLYRGAVLPKLREQPTGCTFPVVPIRGTNGQLFSESVDPQRIGGMASFVGRVQLQQYPIAVADIVEDHEILTKLLDRLGYRMTLDLCLALLGSRSVYGSIPSLAELAQAINAMGPDR